MFEQVFEHLRSETAEVPPNVSPAALPEPAPRLYTLRTCSPEHNNYEAKVCCLIFRGKGSGEYTEERQAGEAGRGEKKESDLRPPY